MNYCKVYVALTAPWMLFSLLPRPAMGQEELLAAEIDGDQMHQLINAELQPVELSEISMADIATSVAVLLAGMTLAWIVFHGIKSLSRVAKESRFQIDDILLRAFAVPSAVAVTLLSVHYALFRIEEIRRAFDRWDGLREATIVLTGTWIAASLVKNLLAFYVLPYAQKTDTDVDERLIRILDLVIVYIIWFAGVLISLRSVGIEITAFLASMGILGLAVALAAKTVLSNVLAGITLTADPSIEIGNRVEVLGYLGDVDRINIHKTVVRTRDNLLVSIPNDVLAKEVVVNWDLPGAMTRMELNIGVDYDTDVDRATEIIFEILDEVGRDHHISEEKPPEVILDAFGDNALQFRIYVWLESCRGRRHIRDAVNRRVLERFRQEGIEIPFPQRVIHRAGSQ